LSVPGFLEYEPFDPTTINPPTDPDGVITLEAAVDIQNRLVILRDPPKDSLPGGGVIKITQAIDYAWAQENDAGWQATIGSNFGGAVSGIRELFIRDESIASTEQASTRAVSELAKALLGETSLSFQTQNPGFQPGQLLFFNDVRASFSKYLIVTEVSIDIGKIGSIARVNYTVTAETIPARKAVGIISAILRRTLRPTRKPVVQGDYTP
jgi:hypothetical protein